jgi:hypothetical protein
MSFEEDELSFRWRCDKCSLEVEFPPTNFWGAWGELKARGWHATKEQDVEGYGWSHHCAACWRKANEGILDRPLRRVK